MSRWIPLLQDAGWDASPKLRFTLYVAFEKFAPMDTKNVALDKIDAWVRLVIFDTWEKKNSCWVLESRNPHVDICTDFDKLVRAQLEVLDPAGTRALFFTGPPKLVSEGKAGGSFTGKVTFPQVFIDAIKAVNRGVFPIA